MTVLLIALGGAAGAAARFWVARRLPGVRATLLVNVVGSLLLGLLLGSGDSLNALLGLGFCGAFTTFSAFAVQTVELPRRRGWVYALVTVSLCLSAAALGIALASAGIGGVIGR